ncbi:MAG: hypothetical protein KDB69_02180 [Acidimicrobiia bacterium]|nr:hypothetical protein [Acidimicrobiia bacterium]
MTIMLVLTACGGSGDTGADADADAGTTTTLTPPPETQATDAAEPPSGDDGDDGSGPSTATVTIDGTTYEFTTEGAIVAQCLTDLFGIFSVQLPNPDGGGVSIVALLPGTDPDVVGENNSVEVDVGDEQWVADEGSDWYDTNGDILKPGMGQVDSIEFDGRTVRGTATFFGEYSLFSGEVETATGTFEATCGEERTT